MTINYNQNIDYGYEVNYLIYNYMVFFKIPIKKLLVMFLQDNVTIFVIIINKNEGIKSVGKLNLIFFSTLIYRL
jgi:hypothetical protein